ncbi:SLATT domain-containing protein [Sporosarcina sp. FSL K6-1522]|uniref:SLATT domain-containing protein n=1 Tax=Sporosarcina sp. FSL K6-1522 TaxID=2921554 RepID=UPI00315AD795
MDIPVRNDESVSSDTEHSLNSAEEKIQESETTLGSEKNRATNSERMNLESETETEFREKLVFNYYNVSKENEKGYRKEILNTIKNFKDKRVYVTKKVRMNSEARLNKNNIHSIILVNVYTFTVLCFSIFSITNETDLKFELLGLIVSMGLFGVSLFVSLFGYREKAIAFKNSYLKINEIEGNLHTLLLNMELTDEELIKAYSVCQKEYNEVLDKTDNHIDKDFIAYKIGSNNATVSEIIKYIYYKISSSIIWVLLYSIPLITMVLMILAFWG